MNKVYVIYWEEKYNDGFVDGGVFPLAYNSFTNAYLEMHKAWEDDKERLMDGGILEENIRNLTTTTQDSITYDNYDEWIKYKIKEVEVA